MTSKSVILLGGPDSGKTNYIARLWPSFRKRKGVLRADKLPSDISYVDGAVEHLMQGSFAPRSDRNLEIGRSDFSISVRADDGRGPLTELMIPDISGELWTRAVTSFEISEEWLELLQTAEGAVLFVRAHSDQIVQPLDWVTARELLKIFTRDDSSNDNADLPAGIESEQIDEIPAEHSETGSGVVSDGPAHPDLPTQVLLCELLRYLDLFLKDRGDGTSPRVAVVVAAWDAVDPELRLGGPLMFLRRQFPLFAGKILAPGRLDIKVFGLSILGGDPEADPDFKATFFEKDISEQGWVVAQNGNDFVQSDDVMLPIAWAVG